MNKFLYIVIGSLGLSYTAYGAEIKSGLMTEFESTHNKMDPYSIHKLSAAHDFAPVIDTRWLTINNIDLPEVTPVCIDVFPTHSAVLKLSVVPFIQWWENAGAKVHRWCWSEKKIRE